MTATGCARAGTGAVPRSRLDRRRSVKELVKRQGLGGPNTFTDEDLRFRQLARRRQPAVHAVVFFMLDVSGSMSDRDRKLAKTFFFWVVQGLRREYRSLETVFVAHTTEAWEFAEGDFFQVTGTGGTVASTGLNKVREIIDARFSPARHNIYLFYASDGDNSIGDHEPAAGGARGHRHQGLLLRVCGGRIGPVAAARHRNRPPVRRCGRQWPARGELRDRRFRWRLGRGAAFLQRGSEGTGMRQTAE